MYRKPSVGKATLPPNNVPLFPNHSYFDVLEDRVPAGLVAEYHSLLARCSELFQEFSSLRNDLTCDSDCELDNVSMVEGVKLYDQLEILKRKLCIIENPLLR